MCVFYGYLTLSCIPVVHCSITDGSVSVCQARGGMHRGLKLSCSAVFISFDIFDYIFTTEFARFPVVFVRTLLPRLNRCKLMNSKIRTGPLTLHTETAMYMCGLMTGATFVVVKEAASPSHGKDSGSLSQQVVIECVGMGFQK